MRSGRGQVLGNIVHELCGKTERRARNKILQPITVVRLFNGTNCPDTLVDGQECTDDDHSAGTKELVLDVPRKEEDDGEGHDDKDRMPVPVLGVGARNAVNEGGCGRGKTESYDVDQYLLGRYFSPGAVRCTVLYCTSD